MMFGNGYGYSGGYTMMNGWNGGIAGVITMILFWTLLVVAIVALWTWIKKNK